MNKEEMAERLAESMKLEIDSNVIDKVVDEAKKVYDMDGNLVNGITFIIEDDVVGAVAKEISASYTINKDDVDEEIYDCTFKDNKKS